MLNQAEKHRYNRHLILDGFGKEAQLKLRSAKVAVVGAGGLGAPVLQYLTAAGVGTIGIIDGDVVAESNLQRQVIFDTSDINASKAEVAAKKLKKQNPFVETIVHDTFLDPSNALKILGQYDLVVDGTDNFQTRYLVGDASSILNIPLVFGSIFKFEGQVSVFNYQDGPGYRCLYPEPPSPQEVPNCSEVGVIGVLPGLIGSLMANEAIKVIAGIGKPLVGRLLLYNALEMTFNELKFSAHSPRVTELLAEYDSFCGYEPPSGSIDPKGLEQLLEQGVALLPEPFPMT